MEIGTAERLTAAASYDLLRRLTEKGVISKERFAKLCSLLRHYNQGIIWKRATMPARSQKELKNTYYTLLYAAGLQKAFRVKTTCETRLKRCLPIPCRTIGCCLNTGRLKI